MYAPRYVQYINLPLIPNDIIEEAIDTIPTYLNNRTNINHPYVWSDFNNHKLDAWCKENICKDIYFAFQLMTGDLHIHKDIVTKTKFNYIILLGGSNVITTFYDDDQTTNLDSYCLAAKQWHIIKVDTYHSVSNIEPGQIRFSVTGKIFE